MCRISTKCKVWKLLCYGKILTFYIISLICSNLNLRDFMIFQYLSFIVMKVFYNHPVGIYMFKVNNRNTRIRRKICSKLTIKTSERPH